MLDLVARCAGGLAGLGVTQGDRVLIYLPMIPEAVIAMLACARLGAVHSVVFGGFAAPELASRMSDADPVAIITATAGIEPGRVVEYLPTVREAIGVSGKRPQVIVKQRPEVAGGATTDTGWYDWDGLLATAPGVDAIPVDAAAPSYILYTSGTTGKPKGVVRDTGGHAVAMAWSMANVYDVGAGDVMWSASDIGWVVGHSYIVYAPLIVGATTVLYEGKPVGTPDAGAFWRVIDDYRVNVLFCAPTAIRAIRKGDPDARELERYDIGSLQTVFAAGERLDESTYQWSTQTLVRPVVDHWWQTETGWPVCANLVGHAALPTKPGSATKPVPGFDVRILDDAGDEVPVGERGNIVIGLPLPPGVLTTIWRDEQRFRASYFDPFPGNFATSDYGYFDEDGYLFVLGRTDDVFNVAGHRLSAGAIESSIGTHPAVVECAVIGMNDELKGQVPVAFVVLRSGLLDIGAVELELNALVRQEIGPLATLRRALAVPALPKTRSGKILRRTLRQIADGNDVTIPPTIEDATVLPAIVEIFARAN